MIYIVAVQRAVAGEAPGIAIPDGLRTAGGPDGSHDAAVEVDQVGVRVRGAGRGIDSVGIVANRTRGSGNNDVQAVELKTVVAQDTGAVVAAVAQGVGRGAFGREVAGLIAAGEEVAPAGAVGSVGTAPADGPGVVGIVTVVTGQDGSALEWGQEADYVGIRPGRRDRMRRRIERLKLAAGIGVVHVADDRRADAQRVIGVTAEADFVRERGIVGGRPDQGDPPNALE